MAEDSKEQTAIQGTPLVNAVSFIETQFPVAKVSMESYKERKANYSQTLTGLGKWWGRKPLVLVRAALLGLLMPASDDPVKDRDIFLKLLTMDAKGLRRRKSKPISEQRLLEELRKMPPSLQKRFVADGVLRKLSKEEKSELQILVFERMGYSEKITYCDRPEQIDGPSREAWTEINAHLGIKAANLSELVQELGKKRFGRCPRVGDAFCGGGSIPFEAARLGCDSYGSDLNPLAALMTWAGLYLVGGNEDLAQKVHDSQAGVYRIVDDQIIEWGIEHNSLGWRAETYLYCVEVIDPETGWRIPLLPSFLVGEKTRTIVKLIPNHENKRYEILVKEGVSDIEFETGRKSGTVNNARLLNPHGSTSTPIALIRRNMRNWTKEDIVPREEDIFQERLYCIQWAETKVDGNGKERTVRHYRAPNIEDIQREKKVKSLLEERLETWQQKGYVPSLPIEYGEKTEELIRTRGWTYWHHLFTPRQLLTNGLLFETVDLNVNNEFSKVACLLGGIFTADYNSRLSRCHTAATNEGIVENALYNQAFNTLYTYGGRPFSKCKNTFFLKNPFLGPFNSSKYVTTTDARSVQEKAQFWITDPPYGDAINYDELADFYLVWIKTQLSNSFPAWYTDSKRALAVKGVAEGFRKSMVDCYKQLAKLMPDNGMQIVMFTHQNASVWADLSLILWASGLRVTAAWTIATETDSALKAGNYVQGTVLLVLRKRTETEPVFLDEISYKVEEEVRRQLDSMTRLEDDSDPNFGDADYQLAAYAAALRVLTSQPIEEINPEKEILRERKSGEVGPVEQLIRRAVKIACDHLIPKGLDAELWKSLGPMERFYIKGLEVESHSEYRSGVYQELARGFGAAEYDALLESTRANETRLKSAGEFGKKMLGTVGAGESFADSLVRQCLFGVFLTVKNEDTREGFNYLKTELKGEYWPNHQRIIGILDYLARLKNAEPMEHWRKDSEAAEWLAGALRNDHV